MSNKLNCEIILFVILVAFYFLVNYFINNRIMDNKELLQVMVIFVVILFFTAYKVLYLKELNFLIGLSHLSLSFILAYFIGSIGFVIRFKYHFIAEVEGRIFYLIFLLEGLITFLISYTVGYVFSRMILRFIN